MHATWNVPNCNDIFSCPWIPICICLFYFQNLLRFDREKAIGVVGILFYLGFIIYSLGNKVPNEDVKEHDLEAGI